MADFDQAATGWYFNREVKKGLIIIKTNSLSTGEEAVVKLSY
jgi:hypothetical protein